MPAGMTKRMLVWCTLATPLVSRDSRVHGWSVSVRADGPGSRIVSARSMFAEQAEFERTEVTSGDGNVGVVSTVVLSGGFPGVTAVAGGTFPIVSVEIDAAVPQSGCAEAQLRYEDGLRDSMGAVIENEILPRRSAPLELEACSSKVCANESGREVCDNQFDDDGDAKIDLADDDCKSFPHPGDCVLFDCGCHPLFELLFLGPDKPFRPLPAVLTMTGDEIAIGATNVVSLVGFELSGRATSIADGFRLELTGDVLDEAREPVRNVLLDTLGNRIPPRVGNTLHATAGQIEAIERGPDLESFGATDFLSVDIDSGPSEPSFRVRYLSDRVSSKAVLAPNAERRNCAPHRILTLKLGPRFHRGDADGDGKLTVTDAIVILLFLFGGRPLSCIEAGNIDDDDAVNITDAIGVLLYLFAGGAPPPHPGPPGMPCGHDRTWSTPFLPCHDYAGC